MTKLPAIPGLESNDEWHITTAESPAMRAACYPAIIYLEHRPTGICRKYALAERTIHELSENSEYIPRFFRQLIESMQNAILQEIAAASDPVIIRNKTPPLLEGN